MDIYTDGACSPNPGRGGWAFVTLDKEFLPDHVSTGGSLETTNNRMELTAIYRAIVYALDSGEVDFTIYSDSMYCLGVCNRNSTKMRKNADIIVPLLDLIDEVISRGLSIDFKWVRAHNGTPGNEFADYYANKEIR